MHPGKLMIVLGAVLLLVGLLWTFVGKLPGDISFKKGNVSFHFPIMTSIIVSVLLTLILFIVNKFR
ncbi:DNA helicase [Lentibacillus sp. JNUCC-1]|uniref:DUF2905 domain-containing protein n=1 Tax=Lentibacillus sp. JNUCC-1 TaxID=2654513 RepID=UPI0012E87C0C|nr:DUF2905 domain-containing protein [Lentibacillus sp. JNUCC-1]MUV39517.1 DNA helicase [Lentibacillus sp. JNUCC-1]